MEDRRIYLALRIEDVARRADVSANTLRSVGRGRAARPLTEAGVERALRWKGGSLQRLREGKPPLLVGGEDPPSKLRDEREWDIWAEEDLSPSARMGAIRKARDESMRRTG